MPKVVKNEYMIAGLRTEVVFYVNTSGQFYFKIDKDLISTLGIQEYTQYFASLKEAEKYIAEAVKKFSDRNTKTELIIAVAFAATGYFVNDDQGHRWADQRFIVSSTFDADDVLKFDFKVYIKEDHGNDHVEYFDAEKGIPLFEQDPNEWYKGRKCYRTPTGVHVGYSEEIYNNLTRVREVLRKASNELYRVFSKETEDLEIILSGSKGLLN